jgi:hypothetical protein
MKVALKSEDSGVGSPWILDVPWLKSATVICGHHFALAALHLTQIFFWRMGNSSGHFAHHHGSFE